MTPPALTWLHLLPRDCAFECASAPEWVRDSLNAPTNRDGRRVIVRWNDPSAGADLKKAAAFVGANVGTSLLKELNSAGLSHIARLAVVPSLEQPRWFIPLGTPAASAGAFNLYSPTRLSARLKQSAARLAARANVPIWYRDEIVIAQRQAPPLEQRMRELFHGKQISIALSAGAPEGARNRKASAAVIAPDGRTLAFLKLAGSDLSETLLRNEVRVLSALAAQGVAQGNVPALLLSERIDGTYTTAQTPLEGRPVPASFAAAHRQFLQSLGTHSQPLGDTEMIRMLSSRIDAMRTAEPQLAGDFDLAIELLERDPAPLAIGHGDFAPWNLRIRNGQIAAFDWEYGSLSGPAGVDEIHHRLQVGHLLENWTVDRALHELRDVNQNILMLYLVDMLARLLSEGYDRSNKMLSWLEQMLGVVSAKAAREVAVA